MRYILASRLIKMFNEILTCSSIESRTHWFNKLKLYRPILFFSLFQYHHSIAYFYGILVVHSSRRQDRGRFWVSAIPPEVLAKLPRHFASIPDDLADLPWILAILPGYLAGLPDALATLPDHIDGILDVLAGTPLVIAISLD